jgi:hypothetical protein
MITGLYFFSFTALVSAALLVRTLFPYFRKIRFFRRLRITGVEADAVILCIQNTGVYLDGKPQVRLQLKVQPGSGRNFVAEAREFLSQAELSQLRVGATTCICYDPAHPKEVMLVRKR